MTIGSAEFTVIQTGTDDVNFKILPEVATASPRGAFANVAVYATPDASWTAESMDSWIKITEGASGAGNGNVKYVTMSNPELEARTGHIKFIPPVAVPDLDLYSGMILWITQKSNIEGNEARQFEYDLSKTFDGSFINELSGTNFPANSTGDFTLSMSVSVSTLDQINRLFTFGSKSIYLTAENELMANSDSLNFTFSKSDKFYTIVLRYTAAEDKCEYYVGERDSELKFCAVLSGTGAPIDLTQAISPNVLKLGYCPYPSFGYLDNGRMDNVRFWARLLTDRECECVDMVSEVLNNSQAGIPSSVTYHYFAMGGNAMCTSEANKMPSIGNLAVTSSYCNVTEGRDRIRCGAVESDGQAKIIINGFANIFKGEDILNNGYDFDDTYDESLGGEYYWVEDRGTSYKLRFPYEVKATEDSEFDATYVLWLNIKALPAEGNVTILKRYLRTASKYAYEHQGRGGCLPILNIILGVVLSH